MIKNIYVLIDPRNNEIKYVGQTINKISKRFSKHINDSKHHNHRNANWIKKLLNIKLLPIIKCIDIVPINDDGFWEMFYILKYKKLGYKLNNHTMGGDGSIGYKHTNETKFKLSKINRAGKNNGMYNKIHSKDAKIKMSLKKQNKYNGKNNPRAKTIYQYDLNINLINIWETAKECADKYNLSRGNISSTAKYNTQAFIDNTNINKKIDELKQYINTENFDNTISSINNLKKELKKYKTVGGFIFKF